MEGKASCGSRVLEQYPLRPNRTSQSRTLERRANSYKGRPRTSKLLEHGASVITSKPANGYHFKTGQWPTFGGTRFSTPSPPDQASAFLGFLTSKFPDS